MPTITTPQGAAVVVAVLQVDNSANPLVKPAFVAEQLRSVARNKAVRGLTRIARRWMVSPFVSLKLLRYLLQLLAELSFGALAEFFWAVAHGRHFR